MFGLSTLAIKAIAAAIVVAALVIGYNFHVHSLVSAAEVKATTTCNANWQDAEKKAIDASEAKARETEAGHAKALALLQTSYQKEIADAKSQRDKDVAAARSGALKLRFAASSPGASDDSKGPGSPVGSDAAAPIELPPAIAGDLFALADDADATADQLRACQAVIISDRKEAP